MAAVNEYFQLIEKDGNAYLRVFPAQSGGKNLDAKEVMLYLDRSGYQNYDLRALNDAVTANDKETDVYIGPWIGFHEQERMEISLSGDKMLVYARFYPPTSKGKLMDAEEIKRDLQAYHIKIGIQDDVIQNYVKNREYCKDILVAKGIPPVQGKDAKIEYFFNTNMNLKPKRNEDGSVNYHELNTINHVEQGQCLARLIPEVQGKSGKNVYGEDVPARSAKTKKLSFGKNIELSEDGLEIHSMVTGHVSLVKDKVFVADVYEVPADVDTATGNIFYDGNVHVKGNVKSGFVVNAKGDIVVEGVVEGAELYAGGQIIVKRGIHGMAKGVLNAKGNIITKFIESATVNSNGYIETESILHSDVSARVEIRVGGKKGFITGGTIRAGNLVSAQTIGSEMGAATQIEVGVDPEVKERYNMLQKQIGDIQKEMDQIRPILENYTKKAAKMEQVSPEKEKQVQMLAKSFRDKQQQMVDLHDEFQQLYETMSLGSNARVKVSGTVYAGVHVSISDVSMNIKSNYSHSQIMIDKGDIVIRPM